MLVPDAGVLDADLIQPGHPRRQLVPAGHAERHMVQSSAALVERVAVIGPVGMQPDDDTRAKEQYGVTGLLALVMRERDRYACHPEQPLVPRHARLDVGDSRREVMDPGKAGCRVFRHAYLPGRPVTTSF